MRTGCQGYRGPVYLKDRKEEEAQGDSRKLCSGFKLHNPELQGREKKKKKRDNMSL